MDQIQFFAAHLPHYLLSVHICSEEINAVASILPNMPMFMQSVTSAVHAGCQRVAKLTGVCGCHDHSDHGKNQAPR
jgi:hypothetical protein